MNFIDRLSAVAPLRQVMGHLLGADRVLALKNGVTNCANPAHEDKHPSMSVDLDKGVFKCFACDAHGGVLDLAVLRGIGRDHADAAEVLARVFRVPQENGHPANSNGRAEPSRDPAPASGPSGTPDWPYYPKTAAALGWERVESHDFPRRGTGPGLKIPTWLADGSRGKTKIRGPRNAAGDVMADFLADGKACGLVNLPAVLAMRGKAKARGALLCGETDVLAWTFHAKDEGIDVPAFSHSTGEGSSLADHAAALAAAGVEILFFPDDDDAGKKNRPLREAELKAAGVSFLSAHVPAPHKDVRDFLKAGGKVRQLIALAEAQKKDRDPWPDLIALDHHDRPPFPVKALGPVLEAWCTATASALQVPVDLCAMLALPVLSAACARKWEVRVRPGWKEPLNCYSLTAMPPGTRKSAAFSAATRVVYEYQEELRGLGKKERLRALAVYEIAEKRYESAKAAVAGARDAATASEAKGRYERELSEFEAMEPPPAEPYLVGDDVTPERAVAILSEQQDRFAVFSPEGGMLQTLAGSRYSKTGSASYDALLKAHAGDPIAHDRKTSGSVSSMHPALTLGLSVQPEILKNLASAPGAKGVGLLARFWYSVPAPTGKRAVRADPVPAEIDLNYRRLVRRLLESPLHDEPIILTFTPEADDVMAAFEEEIETRIQEGGDLHPLVEWASKLCGAAARIAALLAVVDRESAEHVEILDIRCAVEIARYLVQHAKTAFEIAETRDDVQVAERVLAWVDRKNLTHFARRDAFIALKSSRGSVQRLGDVVPALTLLSEYGYIRPAQAPENPGSGRRVEDFYQVRPKG